MATKSGPPIGPFPENVETDQQKEEYDKLRRRVLWKMPYGLYVVGARDGDERNLMTLNWATQVSFDPKLVGIGVEKDAYTHKLISNGGVFSLLILDREDRAIVRKFVKPVEADLEARTLNGFAFHDGVSGAPILDQAVAYADCRVTNPVDCGGHTFFIGEVIDARFQTGNEEVDVLRMEDTRMSYGG
jgi:flavin reductase (DIM6/NTAB) family NADH-FMN oxidoreductase RutF